MNKYSLPALLLIIIVGAIWYVSDKPSSVGGLEFARQDCYTSSATSTLSYMTDGTATTTLSCLGVGPGEATLTVIANASSTGTTYVFYVEESSNGQDWFPVSSTTPSSSFSFQDVGVYERIVFASSTIGATALGASLNQEGAGGTNNRNHYLIDIPLRLQHVRVHAALASTTIPDIQEEGDNGAVRLQIHPKTNL